MVPFAPLLLALATAVDPVGDLPPSLEVVTAPPAAPGPTLVLLPMVGLAVDDGLRERASRQLAARLNERAKVVDGGALSSEQREDLATCDGAACAVALRPTGAEAVVTSSLGPVADEVVLTVRIRSRAGTQRLQVRGPAAGIDDLCARAVSAMPLTVTSSPPPTAPSSPSRPPPPTATSSTSSVPPIAMVLVYYALGFIPVVGSPLMLPFLQGFVAQELGPELVGLEFKDWGNAVAAGYLTYLVGFTVGAGAYVAGATLATSGNSAGIALLAGGAVLVLATVAAEPVVFHLVASAGAVPAAEP